MVLGLTSTERRMGDCFLSYSTSFVYGEKLSFRCGACAPALVTFLSLVYSRVRLTAGRTSDVAVHTSSGGTCAVPAYAAEHSLRRAFVTPGSKYKRLLFLGKYIRAQCNHADDGSPNTAGSLSFPCGTKRLCCLTSCTRFFQRGSQGVGFVVMLCFRTRLVANGYILCFLPGATSHAALLSCRSSQSDGRHNQFRHLVRDAWLMLTIDPDAPKNTLCQVARLVDFGWLSRICPRPATVRQRNNHMAVAFVGPHSPSERSPAGALK